MSKSSNTNWIIGTGYLLNKHEILTFANFYCQFIVNYSNIVVPLTRLTQKDEDELLHNKEDLVMKPRTEAIGYVESLFP